MKPFGGDKGWRAAAVLVLLALSAFLQFSVVLDTKVNDPIRADAEKYVSYAYNLKHAGIFSHVNTWEGPDAATRTAIPDKLTLPGYPAFLTLFMDESPDEAFVRRVVLAQAILGVASTLFAYLIALRLLPLPWAFATGVLVAIGPHMATISTYLLTEALFTVLLLATTLATVVALRPGSRYRSWAMAGILLGMTCLVRPQLQLVPWCALALVLVVQRWRPQLRRVLLAVACFAAVAGPWYVRNAATESPPGDPDLLVITLYHGSFPNMMYRNDPKTYGFPYQNDPDQARITRDMSSILEHIGTSFAEQPVRFASWYLFGKPGSFLSWGVVGGVGGVFIYPVDRSPFLDQPLFKALRSFNFLVHWPLMLLALLASFFAFWRPHALASDEDQQRVAALISAIFIYAIAVHMLGAPFSRYSIPFRPLAYALALAMILATWRRLRSAPLRLQPA